MSLEWQLKKSALMVMSRRSASSLGEPNFCNDHVEQLVQRQKQQETYDTGRNATALTVFFASELDKVNVPVEERRGGRLKML